MLANVKNPGNLFFVNVASFLHFDVSKILIGNKVIPIVEKPPVLKLEHLEELKTLEIDNNIKFGIVMATHDMNAGAANKERAKHMTTPGVVFNSLK